MDINTVKEFVLDYLQREYTFTKYLDKMLPPAKQAESVNLDGKLKLEYYRISKDFEGSISLSQDVEPAELKNPKETYEQLSIFDNYEQIKEENETRLLIGDLNRQMHKSVFKTAADHLRENGNDIKRSK